MPKKKAQEAPQSFDNLRKAIHERYDALSPQQQRMAQAALDDPDGFALGKVVALAEALDAHPSGLVRFAQMFGYSGFSEMQRVFRVRLIEGAPAYRGRIHAHRDRLAAEGDPMGILEEFVDATALTLDQLKEGVERSDLIRAVELLRGARDIYVIGQRRAFPLAAYFAYGLIRLEMRCHLLDSVGGLLPQQAAAIGSEDLLVGISFAEYAPPVVEVVQDAQIRGVPTLTITDALVSPLAKNATVTFILRDVDVHRFKPVAAPMTLIQSMIIAVSYARDKAIEQAKNKGRRTASRR